MFDKYDVYRIIDNNNFLIHYGIKGQKKGHRRYQNEDGSLTPEGYRHYGIDPNGRDKKDENKDSVNEDSNVSEYEAWKSRHPDESNHDPDKYIKYKTQLKKDLDHEFDDPEYKYLLNEELKDTDRIIARDEISKYDENSDDDLELDYGDTKINIGKWEGQKISKDEMYRRYKDAADLSDKLDEYNDEMMMLINKDLDKYKKDSDDQVKKLSKNLRKDYIDVWPYRNGEYEYQVWYNSNPVKELPRIGDHSITVVINKDKKKIEDILLQG